MNTAENPKKSKSENKAQRPQEGAFSKAAEPVLAQFATQADTLAVATHDATTQALATAALNQKKALATLAEQNLGWVDGAGLEAFAQAGNAWLKGFQALNDQWLEGTRAMTRFAAATAATTTELADQTTAPVLQRAAEVVDAAFDAAAKSRAA